jgi:lysophospholipase L1-like esterase
MRSAAVLFARRAPLLAAALALGVAGGWVLGRLQVARALAAQAQPFAAHPADPVRRLLVVGDSTAVGTGASSAAQSVPGLIAAAHPDWRIDNRAVNGATFEDVVAQLQGADGQHDLVLILAGGNDVMRLTSEDALRTRVETAVALARRHARDVTLMPCGDVGHAPFFFAPLSWLMSRRSAMLHAVVAEIAARTGARYVRLLKPRDSDPFLQEPERMNAADGLHPSDRGYRQWYSELQAQGGLAP